MRTALRMATLFGAALVGASSSAHADATCDSNYPNDCLHPTNVVGVTPQSSTSIRISWLPKTTYPDEIDIIRDGNVVTRQHYNAMGNNFWDDQGLKPGTHYAYQVCNVYKSISKTYCGSWGGTTPGGQSSPPPPAIPNPVRNLTGHDDGPTIGPNRIRLHWDPSLGGAPAPTSITVRREATAQRPMQLFHLPPSYQELIDDHLALAEAYTYRVCAETATAQAPCASITVQLPPPPPAPLPGQPPLGTVPDPLAPTGVSAHFTSASPPFANYHVTWKVQQAQLNSGIKVKARGIYPNVDDEWSDVSPILAADATSADVRVVVTGQLYEFAVCAEPKDICSASAIQNGSLPTNLPLFHMPDSLIDDGSFDEQSQHDEVQLPWRIEGDANKGVDIGMGWAHGGLNNGFMRTTTGWNAITQTVPVTPNTDYLLTAWVRTSSNVHDGYFGVRRGSNATVDQEVKYGPMDGWTQLTVRFTSGNETSFTVYCGYWAPGTDSWVQMDDFSLVEAAPFVLFH